MYNTCSKPPTVDYDVIVPSRSRRKQQNMATRLTSNQMLGLGPTLEENQSAYISNRKSCSHTLSLYIFLEPQ